MKRDATLFRIKSVAGTLAFRGLSLGVSFFTVPLLLQLLGKQQYGTWVTCFSITAWLAFWDLGTGFGFKNQLAAYVANNQREGARKLIAANIQLYCCIAIGSLLLFPILCYHFASSQLLLVTLLYLPLILSFPCTIGLKILQSYRRYQLVNWFGFLQSALFLAAVLLYSLWGSVFVAAIGLLYSVVYCLLNGIALCLACRVSHFRLSSVFNLRYFTAAHLKLKTGFVFFIHEITNVVIYFSGNLIIYSHLSAAETARFDVVNRLFLIGISFFNSLLNIYWTEISHAKAQYDFAALKTIQKKLYGIAALFSAGVIASLFIVPLFIPVWTRGMMHIDIITVLPFGISVILQIFNNTACVFLGAFEKMKTITVMYVLLAILMVPLCNLLFPLGCAVYSVPLAAGLLTVPSLLYALVRSEECIRSVKPLQKAL